ncbi:MAG: hypothetical protein CL990_02975 [Euryarchaeota archaeon]|nr:hypothetical protein [Euryarchaeota archaeon]
MSRDVVETVEFGHHFGHLDRCKLTHFEFHAQPCVFTFGVVEDVHPQLGGHVKTVVGADVDAHLARRARLPDHTDASVVVPRNEKPGLHVLEALVRVLDGLGLPERWLQV